MTEQIANRWIDVAASDAVDNGSGIEVLLGDRIVAIFRSDDQLFAVDGMCAHQGGPLADGIVENGCVTCPWHGWQYELASGIQTINRQPLQEVFDIRENSGRIEIRPKQESDSKS